MLLLCRQQSPDISNDNPAVVNLKYMPAATAGKSVERRIGERKKANFQRFRLDTISPDSFSNFFVYSQCLIIIMLIGRVLPKDHISEVQ